MFGNPLGFSLSVANVLHEIIKSPVRNTSSTGGNMTLQYVFLLRKAFLRDTETLIYITRNIQNQTMKSIKT
jgi:hypothetical protein